MVNTVKIGKRTVMLPGFPKPHEEEIEDLEYLGEEKVRWMLSDHSYQGRYNLAKAWLDQKSSERRDERENKLVRAADRANELASDANRLAVSANNAARRANIIAVIAAAIAAATAISAVIFK